MDILADWMARPDITLADFNREHEVVQRELEMGQDDAERQFSYAHMANFYGTHPAAVPVIGYKPALQKVTYQDVLAYHAERYVPRNMVLVIAGDVDAQAMLDRACRAFAGFLPGRSTPNILPEVPQIAGVRRVIYRNPSVKDVAEEVSFRSVPLISEDLYPLDVLSYVLTNGQSSRLFEILRRQKRWSPPSAAVPGRRTGGPGSSPSASAPGRTRPTRPRRTSSPNSAAWPRTA